MSSPTRRSHPAATRIVGAVGVLFVPVLIVACGGDDEAELAPPVPIEVESLIGGGGGSGETMIEDSMTSADSASMPAWNVRYEFAVSGEIGPLPTDDTALHYPAGVTIEASDVAALAERLGVDGEPRPGVEGTAWQVGPDDGSAPSLTVASDALLSWWMSGSWSQWPATEPSDDVLGNLQSASGILATPVPTGPYPLIGLDEAVERLERINRGFGYFPEPVAVDPAIDPAVDDGIAESSPVEDPDEPVSSDEQPTSDDRSDEQPVIEPMPVEPIAPDEVVVETITLVAVEAATWTIWAADGSMWVVPAYRFSDAQGATFDVPAVTDEFLAIDPWFADDPMVDGSGTVDPMEPPAEISIDDASIVLGLELEAAVVAAEERGWSVREARRDGEDLAVTADYVPTRINVAVDGGVVTEVLGIG